MLTNFFNTLIPEKSLEIVRSKTIWKKGINAHSVVCKRVTQLNLTWKNGFTETSAFYISAGGLEDAASRFYVGSMQFCVVFAFTYIY